MRRLSAMYARGMTVREIQGFLLDQYKVERERRFHQHGDRFGVGSRGRVAESAAAERSYPVVYFDALRGEDPRRGKREEQSGVSGL